MFRNLIRRSWATGLGILVAWSAASWCPIARAEDSCTWKLSQDPLVFRSFALSPDGTMFAYRGMTKTGRRGRNAGAVKIQMWDTRSGQRKWVQNAGLDFKGNLTFSPDNQLLACTEGLPFSTPPTELRGTKRGAVVRGLQTPQPVKSMGKGSPSGVGMARTNDYYPPVFSPDGTMLMAVNGHRPNVIELWNPNTGEHLGEFSSGQLSFGTIFFSPDGKRIIAFGNPVKIEYSNRGNIRAMSSQGRADNRKDVLCVWDIASHRRTVEVELEDTPTFGVFRRTVLSRDGGLVAHGVSKPVPGEKYQYQQGVCVRDTTTGEIRFTFDMKADQAFQFDKSGKILFGAHHGRDSLLVEAADLETGKVKEVFRKRFNNGSPILLPATFSPDGEQVAVATDGYVIKLHETRTGTELASLQGPTDQFIAHATIMLPTRHSRHDSDSLLFSNDGSTLVSLATFGTMGRDHKLVNGHVKATAWNLAQPVAEEK